MNILTLPSLLSRSKAVLKIGICLLALSVTPAFSQVTSVPTDASLTDIDETAVNTGMIMNTQPMQLPMSAPLWGSDMDYAAEHDARWGLATTSHVTGAAARIAAYLSKGNTFFVKTGDTFGKIMGAYQEITKMIELYSAMENAWKFLKKYQLTVNLYRFLPVINVDAPDEMGGGQAFAVGLFPKDSTGWEARNNILNDNIWRRKDGLRIVEVRYPRSLNDLTLDASVWGTDSQDEETMQKMLLSGMYDGIVASGQWLNGAGIGNNLADNVSNMGPKAFARRISQVVAQRITALEARKDYLYHISTGQTDMPKGLTPQEVMDQIALIDKEITQLRAKDANGYSSSQMEQSIWMQQAAFVNEILAKLEHTERRLALMKLNERYKKYEQFWANPDQMNPQPEITGIPQVDQAVNLVWSALTLASKGKIPPPVPVSGGLAAQAQATMVRSMYRELLVDELRAVRRLLAFRYAEDRQKEAAETTVQDAKDEVNGMLAVLDQRADHIRRLKQYAEVRKAICDAGESWAFSLPGI